MLTLGLMEGVLTFVAMAMAFLILIENNAPLHRIFAPPALVLSGVIGYGVYDRSAASGVAEIAGLLVLFVIAVIGPLAVMRYAWHATRAGASPQAPASRPIMAEVIDVTPGDRTPAVPPAKHVA